MLIPILIAVAILGGCYMLYHLYEAWQIRKINQEHSFQATIVPNADRPVSDQPVPAFSSELDGARHASDRNPLDSLQDKVTEPSAGDAAFRQPLDILKSSVSPVPALPSQTEAVAGLVSNSEGSETRELPAYQRRTLFEGWRGTAPDDIESSDRIRSDELPIPPEDLAFGSLTPGLSQLLPESNRRREIQEKSLVAAGDRSRAAWLNLNARRFIWAFLTLFAVGIALLVVPARFEPWLIALAVIGPLLAWGVPPLLVSARAAYRKTDIERGIPDVLDMLHMGVSQGLTVPNSLKRIAPEIKGAHPALADELAVVNRQADVGSMRDALHGFSRRIDSQEVSSFTSLLMQSEATGTSISKSLTDYSDSMRSTLKERADSRANSASFWLLFPIVCLMVSVFLFLLSPAIVQLNDFFQNTAGDVLNTRADALQSLEQQPVVVPLDNTP